MTPPVLGSLHSSEQLLQDLYVELRRKIGIWSHVTKQTPQARMGYIGQHLVSVVTGFPGGRSGARGKDLVLPHGESAEIKTCYRIDQLGKCNTCGSGVSSLELECPNIDCNSKDIRRNDDSKWLIGIQHEQEFSEIFTPKYYYLVLFDFTDLNTPDTIRASIWRVDPLSPGFAYCLIDYFKNIKSNSASGAPFNLWPYSLKFELMRPLLIYQSLIMPDNTIQTKIFPGRDDGQHHPLSNLQTFSKSTNLKVEKVKDFASMLNIALPNTDKKLALLTEAQNQIASRQIDFDVVVDALARTLYKSELAPHLDSLPAAMRAKMSTAKLL